MEQHEKLIKITPSCWHYRLIKYIWKIDPKMFMNLCPYFWLTIASLFVLPFVWFYNVIKNGFITFFDKISEHMDKIFDKELENWVKTLNEAQIIELDKFGWNSEDVSVPYSFKKKASPWDAVHKWCKLHNVSTIELYKKVGLYEEFKEKMRLRRAELRKVAAEKESRKQAITDKRKADREKMNKVIKNTKQIAGFIITLFLAFIFFFIVKLFVFIFTLFVEFVILNSVECGCAIGYMALVALIGFIIYLYCMRVGSIVDRITDKQHASFKEWIMAIPALIVIGICYVIFYCIIYVFLWKWIIYATYVGLRNAFFTFTGIFGEYFGASYSDYCPGIEWDEKEED